MDIDQKKMFDPEIGDLVKICYSNKIIVIGYIKGIINSRFVIRWLNDSNENRYSLESLKIIFKNKTWELIKRNKKK